MTTLEVMGVTEIAERLERDTGYVSVLIQRGKLPRPDAIVGGRKVWRRSTIENWITRNGPTINERNGGTK